jgi:hypothetical protein
MEVIPWYLAALAVFVPLAAWTYADSFKNLKNRIYEAYGRLWLRMMSHHDHPRYRRDYESRH